MNKKLSLNIRKKIHAFGVVVLVLGQLIMPFTGIAPVHAANEITASDHEGQEKPGGTYSNGNITTYAELDSINFRFTLQSSATASGQMQVGFTGPDGFCDFFDGTFVLGTHDGSAPAVELVSGSSPTISTVGSPTVSGDEWRQVLNVDFPASGEVVVNYYLTLTDEAGDCNGSSQHSRLYNVDGPSGGGFGNIGAQNVPVPAKDIIELASITVTKYIDEDGDGQTDRTATAGEWNFSLDGGASVGTDSNGQVVFSNLQTGDYIISESGPPEYSFIGVSGTNCVEGSDPATAVASVVAAPTAVDASCDFSNGINPGSITIVKEIITNNADVDQTFDFTSPDGGVAGPITVTNGTVQNTLSQSLNPGTYTTSEIVPGGWELTDLECVDGANTSVNLATATATITLGGGEDVTCTFTNTQLATINVEKFVEPNDANGSFTFTGDVSGTIDLPGDNQLSAQVLPGTYTSTETGQDLWKLQDIVCDDDTSDTPSTGDVDTATATFNVGPGDVVTCVFSNIQYGSIQVLKNVDSNGDGTVDITGATDWQWTLDGGDLRNTGDPAVDVMPNDTYSIAEIMKDGYHVTDLTCDGQSLGAVESTSIEVSPGEHVVCTFTNTRDTGTIVVNKIVNPTNDNGLFSLLVNGQNVAADVGHGGTGSLQVVTGSHDVSETAGDNTDLGDYHSSYVCDDDAQTSGNGTSISVDVSRHGQTVTCTFTNVRLGSITVEKVTDPASSDQQFSFDVSGPDGFTEDFDLDTDNSTVLSNSEVLNGLLPGDYSIEELDAAGWKLTGIDCSTDHAEPDSRTASVTLAAGENISCTFTNVQTFDLTVIKVTDPGSVDQDFDFTVTGNGPNAFSLNTSGVDTKTIENLLPGSYTVLEDLLAGWHFEDDADKSFCTIETDAAGESDQTVGFDLVVPAGTTSVTCTFTNVQESTIIIQKAVDPTDSDRDYDFTSTSGNWDWDTVKSIKHDGQIVQDQLLPGIYSVTEEPDDGSVLKSIECTTNNDTEVQYDADVSTRTLDIDVEAGNGTITCIFSNVEHATIVAQKVTDPAGSNEGFDVTLSDGFVFGDGVRTKTMEGDGGSVEFVVDGDGGVTYSMEEVNMPDGWDPTNAVCDNQDEPKSISINPGETVVCTFTNTQRGSIQVLKNVDSNGDGTVDITGATDWQWTLDGGDPRNTGNPAVEVMPNETYTIAEIMKDGYHVTDLTCDEESLGAVESTSIEVSPGEDVTCTFTNTRDTGTITIEKLLAEEPEVDETFSFNSSDGGLSGDIAFVNGATTDTLTKEVVTGTYTSAEDLPVGWDLDSIVCNDVESATPSTGDVATATATFNVDKEDNITCTFTNSLNDLTLLIEKSVNTPTADIGDLVTYTLVVTNDSDGISEDTIVTDLPPEGFAYQSVGWSADSSREDHLVMEDIGGGGPTYASPGDWNLGIMMPGEVITLTYMAMVTSVVDPGEYPDLAYVEGNTLSGTQVFGNIHTEGDPFVGTEVLIAADTPVVAQFTPSVETTVTRLPVTGAMLVWIPSAIAFVSTILFENRRTRRKGALV